MFNFNHTDNSPTPEEIEAAQLRLLAQQDQWEAQWGEHSTPPPLDRPTLRAVWELIRSNDRIVRAAAQLIESGSGFSPYSLQRLKNAIFLNEAGNAWQAGQITAEELDAFAEAMTDPAEIAAMKQSLVEDADNDAQQQRNSDNDDEDA